MSSANVTTSASKSAEKSAQPQAIVHASESDKTCVVCFKIVDIFSIGECDHPVCYECSTRMRVLCKQNECPICRRINQKVIFTSEILPYKELDQKNRSCLYDKQFRICFTGQRAQNAFRRLLEHTCNKCNSETFDTAAELKDHLRKKHEVFYCDICMEHLKIFSFERRSYTREQLAMHRRKGDPDNKSHRGHPLCEFCDERYLDRDELFRHLRKEHYFCHYCDADGSNHFYPDHTRLREHFIDQHFLCEEGDCKENIFSAVFRSDIDLKAHKANAHGQTSKQARTIEFQFNLAPRGRANQHQEHNTAALQNSFDTPTTTTTTNPTRKIIDARNEQEFPSLGNVPINIRPTLALNMRPTTSGLARTKENFPALGGGSSQPFRPPNTTPTVNASTLLFKAPAKPASTNNTSNKNGATNKTKSVPIKTHDFPALPGSASSSKSQRLNLESDMIETPLSFNPTAVSSKHRVLVQAFDTSSSAANALANQKIKTIQRTETKPQSVSNDHVPSIKSKENFPALGGGGSGSSSAAAPQWLNGTNGKKQPQISKKLKVAPAPILPTTKSIETGKKDEAKSKSNQNEKKKDKTDNSNGKKTEKEKQKKTDDSAKKTKEKNEKNANKNEKKTNDASNHNGTTNSTSSSTNETVNSYSSVAVFTMPPPGFPARKNEKSTTIPPGFEKISSDAKPSTYMSPSNALQRNQILVSHFMKSLKPAAVDEFRTVSKMFRIGSCNSRSYYEHCEAVLGERFENIFPELLALLPDISKQQELYQTYIEKHSQDKSNDLSKLNRYIQVCDQCRQVVKRGDYPEHIKLHNEIENDNKLNKNFPKLSVKK